MCEITEPCTSAYRYVVVLKLPGVSSGCCGSGVGARPAAADRPLLLLPL